VPDDGFIPEHVLDAMGLSYEEKLARWKPPGVNAEATRQAIARYQALPDEEIARIDAEADRRAAALDAAGIPYHPDGLCGDPLCHCDDPDCYCHEDEDHQNQDPRLAAIIADRARTRTRAPRRHPSATVGPVTVTMSEGDDEDLRGFYARMQRGASSGW
jgi:hypothetical protein